jgi:tRNA/rRNA methyltransferase
MKEMKNISIVLIEPQYEINLGFISRVMKNFGIMDLYLIKNRVNLDKARKFASHGYDVVEKSKEIDFEKLPRMFEMIVGTTAKSSLNTSNLLRNVITPENLADSLKNFGGKMCILFGRESTGLTNEELKKCDLVVSIKTGTDYETMNISHSVAIILYELSKKRGTYNISIAPRKDRERIIQYSLELAKITGFPQHKIPLIGRGVQRIIEKAKLTPRESFLLMGLLRKSILFREKGFTSKSTE